MVLWSLCSYNIKNKLFFIRFVLILNMAFMTSIIKASCVTCHGSAKSIEDSHRSFSCDLCHKGSIKVKYDKNQAHKGLIKIPGNLSNSIETCGQSGCHKSIHQNVEKSLMNRTPGIISSVFQLWGEVPSHDQFQRRDLQSSIPGSLFLQKM